MEFRSIAAFALVAFFVSMAVTLLDPADVFAQGSPGPMSKAHSHLTSFPVDCNKCHEAGYGVPDEKCLACHTHQPLRARIRADKGFHATKKVKAKKCKDCHAEHIEEPPGSGRGRRTTIDWRPFGGKRNFNHRLTGWPLEGAHRYEKCESCHDKKYPRTKLPSYLGLREECTTCHFGTKKKSGPGGHNPHQFTDVGLTDCLTCHTYANFRVKNLGATKFDHDETDYPLRGFHKRNECVACHEQDIEKFQVKENFSDCKGCHEDSHKSVISAERQCKSCHSQKTRFRKTTFDHGKETRFDLRGQHARNRCKDCHEIGSEPVAPKMACATCHEDIHQGRFEPEPCEGCHVDLGFSKMIYDHDEKTKFDLTGKHETTDCTNCHRFGLAKKFERFESTECADCHRHDNAHCGQFGMENCERCHVRGGDRTSKFDHSLTRFPLERAHAEVDCSRCHKPAQLGKSRECRDAVKYTGLEPQCFACHVDIHKGELGEDCAKCHTAGENFKTLVFDHNQDAQFPLTGFHQMVNCDDCHPKRKYKLGEIRCVSCHKEDDAHEGELGDACSKCHETTGGAPKFDHNIHTDFERFGVHARIECERCHFLNPDGDSYVTEIESLKTKLGGPSAEPSSEPEGEGGEEAKGESSAEGEGGTRTKGGQEEDAAAEAHEVKEQLDLSGAVKDPERVLQLERRLRMLPAIAPPGAPLDLEFRAAGSECDDCHPDPHQVRENLDCVSCHGFEQWEAPPRNGYHESAGFELTGAHTVVACSLCHDGSGNMSGKGERCGSCHVQDDIHAGSFGSDCGRCHEQLGWIPTTFTHVDTGYVLEGIHRMLECRQCHQGGNYFIGDQCMNCHLDDYRGAEWHNTLDTIANDGNNVWNITGGAIGEQSLDCDRCHNQFTFYVGTYVEPQ